MAWDREFSWRRCIAWSIALGLHAALIVGLTVPTIRFEAPPVDPSELAPAWVPVDWVPTTSHQPIPPRLEREPPAAATRPSPSIPARRRRPEVTRDSALAEASPTPVSTIDADRATPDAPVARTIHYLDDEARAILPHENLYAAEPAPRDGDYFTPGDGSEDDVFYRPRALDPNPSRFAHAWRPRGNLIDDWLGQLVEKTTGTVSVPLNAKFSLVCKASIAGMAGGCMIVRNGGTGVIVQRPPPAPWERSNRVQCRELREALEASEEAEQVAYFLDRLSALCSASDTAEGAGNDEARREAGLQGSSEGADQRSYL